MIRFLILICVLTFSSCSLFDNENNIPAFVEFSSVDLITTPDEGANTHNITDIWVNVNGELLGIFPLPAKVPVIITSETTELIIFAGIRANGTNSNAIQYPFFDPINFEMELNEGDVVQKDLTFRYREDKVVEFVEGFESGHIFTRDEDQNPLTNLVTTTEEARSGQKSGLIHLESENNSIEVSTVFEYLRSQNLGGSVFLEMDYKNEMDLLVGTITETDNFLDKIYKVVIVPRNEWNKIYIDITDEISNPDIESYRITFASQISGSPGSEGKIFLDNIKLIHF